MKSYTQYLTVCTDKRYQIVNITPQVEEALEKAAFGKGCAW